MDVSIILIFIIISAMIGLVAMLVFRKKPKENPQEQAAVDYADGLNYLLSGEKEKALVKLRAAVTKNSHNIDAYLKIGDILRELGQVERAINVHKYLTVRTGLNFKRQQNILESLTKDYVASEEYDKALGVVNKVLVENRQSVWARKMKLVIFEEKQDWIHAFETYRSTKKYINDFQPLRLSEYKMKQGEHLLEENSEKEAQLCFKEAIKIAPDNSAAYIFLADSFIRGKQKNEALKILKEFVTKNPEHSFLAFERIKELLYEAGVYGEIENLYLDILQKQPDNVLVMLALAENYEKKGEVEKAIQTSLNILEKDATNKSARKYLVRLYSRAGDKDEALKYALELINNSTN